MKINEAEALVGITRKNIRFYEEEGLLTPRRNRANGYQELLTNARQLATKRMVDEAEALEGFRSGGQSGADDSLFSPP